jgi:undecaprenyl-diphosphatase
MKISFFNASCLGVIQGITEFLPISSDGHLALAGYYLGLEPNLGFIVFLHWATALAVIVYFRRQLGFLTQGFIMSFVPIWRSKSFAPILRDEWMWGAWLVLLATAPTAVVGLLLKDYVESQLNRPETAAVFLIVSGLFILAGVFVLRFFIKGKWRSLSAGQALLLGVVQGLAVLPGLSRSGSTVSVGLMLGLEPLNAARFSFYMGLPAIVGAGLLELPELFEYPLGIEAYWAFALSFAVGLLAIHILLKSLSSRWFWVFGVYCLLLGVGVRWLT